MLHPGNTTRQHGSSVSTCSINITLRAGLRLNARKGMWPRMYNNIYVPAMWRYFGKVVSGLWHYRDNAVTRQRLIESHSFVVMSWVSFFLYSFSSRKLFVKEVRSFSERKWVRWQTGVTTKWLARLSLITDKDGANPSTVFPFYILSRKLSKKRRAVIMERTTERFVPSGVS